MSVFGHGCSCLPSSRPSCGGSTAPLRTDNLGRHAGRAISAAHGDRFVAWILGGTLLSGNPMGTLLTRCSMCSSAAPCSSSIGLGLAFLCSQPIRGKNFFRVIFFIPLMITPLGVGYAMKMVADITKGPFEPFWDFVGLENWAWSADAWARALRHDDLRFLAVDPVHLHLHAGSS